MRLLIIEDEKTLCDLIAEGLRLAGFEVDQAYDGDSGWQFMLSESYDAIVLDLNLPGRDGMVLLRAFREQDQETKILILSARSSVDEKVKGLDEGANDFMTKPFHLAELEARLRSLTRRSFIQQEVCLYAGNLCFDGKSRKVSVCGKPVSLTRKETGILEYLFLHQGRPVSQEELIEHVWDSSVDCFSNSIRVHISSLRKKLKAELSYDPIRNRVGEGYLLEDQH